MMQGENGYSEKQNCQKDLKLIYRIKLTEICPALEITQFSWEWLKNAKNAGINGKMAGPFRKLILKCFSYLKKNLKNIKQTS